VEASGRYLLARHVFVCVPGEQAILLDLHHDQYLALGGEISRHLGRALVDWPLAPADGSDLEPGIDATIEELARRGLITLDPLRGKPAGVVNISLPAETLLPPASLFVDSRDSERAHRVWRLAWIVFSAMQARIWLRIRSIERIVTDLSRGQGHPPLDVTLARSLVTLFFDARPFLFSARDACLFDSLALLLFLRRWGVHPQWVFGVRTGPFAAHCWLQSGSTVLNDTVDNVRSYTPIMAV